MRLLIYVCMHLYNLENKLTCYDAVLIAKYGNNEGVGKGERNEDG